MRKASAGWRHLFVSICSVACGALLLGACSTATAGPTASATCGTRTRETADPGTAHASTPVTAAAHTTRAAPHIMILVMENEGYRQIVGNRAARCANTLAAAYLRATDSYARGHDSLPNYLEMISGHAYEASGTSKDCTPSDCGRIAGTTIADQLQAAGIRWRAFMGAMPSDCDTGNAGGPGGYGVRHNPFVYFRQGRTSAECGHDVPASGMLAALDSPSPPSFVFYSPRVCDDGGQDAPCSTIAAGDRFLSRRIPEIMATSWYRHGGTIILTWDEASDSDTSGRHGDNGGHVLTVVISARTKGSAPFTRYVDTAGILRTVEHAYRLRYLGDAAKPSSGMLPLGSSRR